MEIKEKKEAVVYIMAGDKIEDK
jgi:hypothetical protein